MHRFSVRRTAPGSLRVSGDIDIFTAPQLNAALADELRTGSTLVLDVSKVPFIDSTGLRVLLEAARGLRGELVMVHPSPAVERILALRGVEGFLGLRVVHRQAA